jgi:hypothetical protein
LVKSIVVVVRSHHTRCNNRMCVGFIKMSMSCCNARLANAMCTSSNGVAVAGSLGLAWNHTTVLDTYSLWSKYGVGRRWRRGYELVVVRVVEEEHAMKKLEDVC